MTSSSRSDLSYNFVKCTSKCGALIKGTVKRGAQLIRGTSKRGAQLIGGTSEHGALLRGGHSLIRA